jgi:hypothetical protein
VCSRVTDCTAPGKRDAKYFLDKPLLLDIVGFIPPLDGREGDCIRVCATFFSWATHMSNKFVASRNNPIMRVREVRGVTNHKSNAINLWLVNMGYQYQQSPDSALILLPFVDRK